MRFTAASKTSVNSVSRERERGRSSLRPAILVLCLLCLAACSYFFVKVTFADPLEVARHRLSDVKRLLSECQDKLSRASKIADLAKQQREVLLSTMASEKNLRETEKKKLESLNHEYSELQRNLEAETLHTQETVRELKSRLSSQSMPSKSPDDRLEREVTKLNKALSEKKEQVLRTRGKAQVESYHKLIVSQREDLDRKGVLIARLSDELYQLRGRGKVKSGLSTPPPSPTAIAAAGGDVVVVVAAAAAD